MADLIRVSTRTGRGESPRNLGLSAKTPQRVLLVNASTSADRDFAVFSGRPVEHVYPIGLEYTARSLMDRGHTVVVCDLPTIFPVTGGLPSRHATISDDMSQIVNLLAHNEAGRVRHLQQAIAGFRPELVGFSFRNLDASVFNPITGTFLKALQRYVSATRDIASNPLVVLGGAGFSIAPQSILDFVGADFGILGASETAFPELISRLTESSVQPGAIFRSPFDFSSAVYPRGRIYGLSPDFYVMAGAAGSVQTKRGCEQVCDYCSYPNVEGANLQNRPVSTVLDEMEQVAHLGFQSLWFVDSVFNRPVDYAKQILRGMASRMAIQGSEMGKLRAWHSWKNPLGFDEEFIDLLCETGGALQGRKTDKFTVAINLDGGSDTVLAGLKKDYRREDILRTTQMIKERGHQVSVSMLIGGEGESLATIRQACEMVKTVGPKSVIFQVGVRVYPGTPIASRTRGRLWQTETDLLSPIFAPIGGEALTPDLWFRYQGIIKEELRGSLPENQIIFV